MVSSLVRLITPLLLLLTLAGSAFAEDGLAIDPVTCLGCHRDKISASALAESVHGKNGCTSCHVEIVDIAKHMRGETKVNKVACERCHKKENAEHYNSVHVQKGVR